MPVARCAAFGRIFNMTVDDQAILVQALALPPRKREALAEKLWLSLEDDTRKGIQRAWLDEIGRRVEELRSGMVKKIAGKKVMQGIRKDILKK